MADFIYPKHYDVLVIGAGHAGIEAAHAAARMGRSVLMLTQNVDTIGQMSCNPAIGGLAKGHMVREIDALGGLMGQNADATGIQFRMLNASKGPSVRAPRAQCDKKAYQFRAKWLLEQTPNLDIKQANVTQLLTKNDRVTGIETNLGIVFNASAVIVTTGTFMRGLLHVGQRNQAGGRMGDGPSSFSDSLKNLGFEIGRFKTGTPCRLLAKSIDLKSLEEQPGQTPPPLFSFLSSQIKRDPREIFTLNYHENGMFHVEQINCWIAHTNENTHEIIRQNLDKSPMYAGIIEGVGPRYCPSIEDKVVRFAEKNSHQLFLEPEGLQTDELYVNGISTSLPFDVQYAFIRSIKGMENAEILRPGYAVEYDYCPPTQLFPTLETKRIENLYFAGQINGTSGYEEAAAQGLMAGTNAGLKQQKKPAFVLKRSEAYIGVLIDDLITQGTQEPYRMFTSRAEYRLLLRQDNADLRLTPHAINIGLADQTRRHSFEEKSKSRESLITYCKSINYDSLKLAAWLKRPENNISKLPADIKKDFSEELWFSIESDLKYEGYIKRQQEHIDKAERREARAIPKDISYAGINGLRAEAVQKLQEIQPATLGQAARISGVTPADLSIVSIWLEKNRRCSQD
ncbi:MAG: tRNA uridine-5-carboxymethylaminomethyl(34) synthesis enzyme MnmG [Chthoniobacterales bacterium]